MGIDDESSHPELCSEVAGGVTRNIVCLFREPDAGNLPVRFDEREQETELCQTGLRRRHAKATPTATGRLKPLRLFSTLLNHTHNRITQPYSPPPACKHKAVCVNNGQLKQFNYGVVQDRGEAAFWHDLCQRVGRA